MRWLLRRWLHLWGRAEVFWPSVAFLTVSPPAAHAPAAPFCVLSEAPSCLPVGFLSCSVQSATAAPPVAFPVTEQHSVEARLEWCLEGMGRLLSNRLTRAEPRADIQRTRDDGLAHNAAYRADHSHVPAVLVEDALRTNCVKKPSAMQPTRAWSPSPKRVNNRLYEQKCEEAAGNETMFNSSTIKDTLGKAEALEKHVNTVTMRGESLASTGADLFRTLLDRQEEAQKETPERVFSAVTPAKHHYPLHTLKNYAAEKNSEEETSKCALNFAFSAYRVLLCCLESTRSARCPRACHPLLQHV